MINKINELIAEHVQNGWATDYEASMQFEGTQEEFANKMYDVGRYESLLLIKRMMED